MGVPYHKIPGSATGASGDGKEGGGKMQGAGDVPRPLAADAFPTKLLKNSLLPRLLKKVQMQGGARREVRGVLGPYVAAPCERANAADGPF